MMSGEPVPVDGGRAVIHGKYASGGDVERAAADPDWKHQARREVVEVGTLSLQVGGLHRKQDAAVC